MNQVNAGDDEDYIHAGVDDNNVVVDVVVFVYVIVAVVFETFIILTGIIYPFLNEFSKAAFHYFVT